MGRINSFLKDTSGNVTMMVALFLTVLLGAVGFAVDSSSIRSHTSDLQIAADSAALAGAANALDMSPLARGELAEQAFFANISEDTAGVVAGEPVITFDDNSSQVTVTAKARPKLYLMGMFTGKKTADISIKSVAGYQSVSSRPISVALVLDISSSMSWNTSDGRVKIDVLKEAAVNLLDEVESATTVNGVYQVDVFTSVATYDSSIVDAPFLTPGVNASRDLVRNIETGSGTSSTDAFDASLDTLLAHPNRISQNYQEYIVFMTDGDNNDPQDDVLTEEFCVRARENNITVYSIAFTAPDNGKQLLLKCASSRSDPGQNSENKNVRPFGHHGRPCQVALASAVIRARCERAKEGFYYDAETGTDLTQIFADIGASIGDESVRIIQ